MKLRGAKNYVIGLDIGTGSVGWAATTSERELLRFKGQPTWGSRLFDGADTAAGTRVKRGLRRRYDRRRQRLDWLQEFFDAEMTKVDPEFFIRLRQSRLLKEDREAGHADYRWPLFNDSDFTERDYYDRFPTIYHLRDWLIKANEKADIRLVYLALHNIVKHRGNFLYQDNPTLSAKNADVSAAAGALFDAYAEWANEREDTDFDLDREETVEAISDVLKSRDTRRAERRETLCRALSLSSKDKRANALAGAILGYKVDFSLIFDVEMENSNVGLGNDEQAEALEDSCPDDLLPYLEAIRALFSAFTLMGILSSAKSGDTLSTCKVADYDHYAEDLKTLKLLVREYAPDCYEEFFRGPKYEGCADYDVSKAKGYTRYNMGPSKSGSGAKPMDYESFKKEVESLFRGTGAESNSRYVKMMGDFAEERFLRRLKTSDNGSIPYQLHLEEMDTILRKQGAYYPFLLENLEKIESLVSFRIPYYVGPLSPESDASRDPRFAWSVRKEGQENTPIRPWNWEEVIDKDASAEKFIMRMTSRCTYLPGEDVLPRCSLLYEEYCALNELNSMKWSQDGDKEHRFTFVDRDGIMEDVLKRHKPGTYKNIEAWLKNHGRSHPHVVGAQGETGMISRLSSRSFFCKLLGKDDLDSADEEMAEEIILWSTLFEDRSILRDKLATKYGDRLDSDQIAKICRKRFTGWGKLSRKLLCGITTQTQDGPMTVMDVLRDGAPGTGRAMNLMEAISDKELGLGVLIEEEAASYLRSATDLDINELPGSPALRRGVNQAMKIVEEIVSIAGNPPSAIYVEVTREENPLLKGRRTRERYARIKEAIEAFKREAPDLYAEFRSTTNSDMVDDRLYLYFTQCGKSMYSGKPLDIRSLSTYQIDHVIPQCLIKDDSIENRVLVLPGENQAKSDSMLLDSAIIRKQKSWWAKLFDLGLIGQKKFNNLMRERFSDKQLEGFIARQLVETSQTIKLVQAMLGQAYPDTEIIPVKAAQSSALRDEKALDLVKVREANNFHHAHDAYLACCVGTFVHTFYPDALRNPITVARMMKKLLKEQGESIRHGLKTPGSVGFFVGRFLKSQVNSETGEVWDHSAEAALIRKQIDYRQCFISRMPVEDSGAFWDETIYSPRAAKGDIPLKKGLDPKKYGNYSREQFACFFVYRVKDKKGKESIEWDALPVSVASSAKGDKDATTRAITRYATELATSKGLEFQGIVRSKVLKNQLMEMDGNRFYVRGMKEVRNAVELAFTQKELKFLQRELSGEGDDESSAIYEVLANRLANCAPKLASNLKLTTENATRIALLDPLDRASLVEALLKISSAAANVVDTTLYGGSKHAGSILLTFKKELSRKENRVVFVDQSVTGMFEKRTIIGL